MPHDTPTRPKPGTGGTPARRGGGPPRRGYGGRREQGAEQSRGRERAGAESREQWRAAVEPGPAVGQDRVPPTRPRRPVGGLGPPLAAPGPTGTP